MSTGLRLDSVTITIGGRRWFAPITLAVAPGETVTVMGPSGAGKSTLLAYVCGTLDPGIAGQGTVELDGRSIENLPPEQRRIGILFQDDLLFPHMSVGDNLKFGLPATIRRRSERRARIEVALAEAGLGGFADRDPATLSGGERARVALLRTLLAEPRALLLDEPFGRLDAALRQRFRRLVLDRARRKGLPVLLVTHDPEDAAAAEGTILKLAGFTDSQ